MKKRKTMLRTAAAVGLCKLTRGILRLTGKGGTTLPGRIALSIDRDVLSTVSRGMHIVLVTGTNGKTTTCRMLEKAITLEGKPCLLNRSGANLLPGITAELVCSADRKGNPLADYAVIECDEGALKQVTMRLRPDVIVVTNLFRDQLDRYGEVMNTREEILRGIGNAPESCLCLNADCILTASLAEDLPNPVFYYGIDTPPEEQQEKELSDAKYCLHCGAELIYRYHTYAHLGDYYCPSCGRRRPQPGISAEGTVESSADHSEVRLRFADESITAEVSIPGVYNLYNALAAVSAGTALGLGRDSLVRALGTVEAPFGRMEHFTINGCSIRMILVKNPAGCDQAVDYVTGVGEDYEIAFCLNDRTADGHDVSWIWDADLEKIARDPRRRSVWVSGVRAEDMQLRLKYAGIPEKEITMEKDYARLIGRISRKGRMVFLLPNYTSMLDLRRALVKKTGDGAFWKG